MTYAEFQKAIIGIVHDCKQGGAWLWQDHPGYPVLMEALHKIALETDPYFPPPEKGKCRMYAQGLVLSERADPEAIIAVMLLIFGTT